jgi:sRNA-binding protein
MDRLVQTYPGVFFPFNERQVKPLKLGIHKDLAPVIKEWGYEVIVLKYALGGYTRQLRYQMALLKSGHRINLQAEPAGEITEAHRQTAQDKVALIKEKRKQTRSMQEPQASEPRPKATKPAKAVNAKAIAALQKRLSKKAAS